MMAFLAYMAVGVIDLLFAGLVVFAIYIGIYTLCSSSHLWGITAVMAVLFIWAAGSYIVYVVRRRLLPRPAVAVVGYGGHPAHGIDPRFGYVLESIENNDGRDLVDSELSDLTLGERDSESNFTDAHDRGRRASAPSPSPSPPECQALDPAREFSLIPEMPAAPRPGFARLAHPVILSYAPPMPADRFMVHEMDTLIPPVMAEVDANVTVHYYYLGEDEYRYYL